MSTLILDKKDLLPYMGILIEGLTIALADPINEIRSYASKSLGMLAAKLGQHQSELHFKFLYEILESES